LISILDEIVSLPVRDFNVVLGPHQIFFEDLLTNRYSNYVIQKAFEFSDLGRRQIMLDKI